MACAVFFKNDNSPSRCVSEMTDKWDGRERRRVSDRRESFGRRRDDVDPGSFFKFGVYQLDNNVCFSSKCEQYMRRKGPSYMNTICQDCYRKKHEKD